MFKDVFKLQAQILGLMQSTLTRMCSFPINIYSNLICYKKQVCYVSFQYLFMINCTFLFQHSDMNDEMKTECMELCVTACEKFSANNEVSITD